MMPKRQKINDIFKSNPIDTETTVMGWVRTFRNNTFIAVSDGSCMSTLQVVVDRDTLSEDTLSRIKTGTALRASGKLVASQGRGQSIELQASEIEIYGDADPEKYPL